MSKNDWTNQLHRRLSTHEESVPEGLWESIEAALAAQAPQERRARIVAWHRWMAAAAVALLLGGAGVVYFSSSNQLAKVVPTHKERAPFDVATTGNPTAKVGKVESAGSAIRPASPTLPAAHAARVPSGTTAYIPQIHADEASLATHVPTDSASNSEELPRKTQQKDQPGKGKSESTKPSSPTTKPYESLYLAKNTAKRESRWSAGVEASNLFSSNVGTGVNNTSGVLMSAAKASTFYFAGNDGDENSKPKEPIYLANHEERAEHKRPVSVGLKARYRLGKQFSLESGLIYTRLESEFTHKSLNLQMTEKQTLHYIGIPLHVNYNVWKTGNFAVYTTGGGQIDVNVKAKTKTESGETSIKKDRPQLSLGAGAGVEYNFIPQLGLYFEPNVKYYFDNGSAVENSFKDKPWSINLQLGVRWTVR
ncbi:MAG: PorT family protein [Prevotella sp.]|nr:PorT family protein [Prevotella sp.]